MSNPVFFFAKTFWSLKHFGHLSRSCIKTRRNSVFRLYFQTFWPKWLNCFRSFQNHFGLWPKKWRSIIYTTLRFKMRAQLMTSEKVCISLLFCHLVLFQPFKELSHNGDSIYGAHESRQSHKPTSSISKFFNTLQWIMAWE